MTGPTAAHARAGRRRLSFAIGAVTFVNWLSRILGRGRGTVVGGRAGLAIEPTLLAALAEHRRITLVTGTNGKTTTTKLLVQALSVGDGPPVATNATGANMPAGHVAALVGEPEAAVAVLEVDEGYLAPVMAETDPSVVILLNLSRDQLDRIAEVRMLADRWRAAMERLAGEGGGPDGSRPSGRPVTVVVANADDPMVVWAALPAPEVVWVGAGQVWRADSVGCPACGSRIEFGARGDWACDRCGLARPRRAAWLDGTEMVLCDGSRQPVVLGLPGEFNRANAVMVAVAARELGDGGTSPDGPDRHLDVSSVLARLAVVHEVAGRFSTATWRGHEVRLLLAKNPAGWTALLDLLDEPAEWRTPVVLAVNARTADGLDTSWLWDVPFERLAGRPVVATGDRRLDLAVRLRYAEVGHTVVSEPLVALDRAVTMEPLADHPVECIGNYTAFADLRARL